VRVLLGRQREAREVLRAIRGRAETHASGRLAAVRLVDLRLTPNPPERQIEALLRVVATGAPALRRYALGVLVHVLRDQGSVEDALAAATRLAYEGDSALLTPLYRGDLDEILKKSVAVARDEAGCLTVVRRLGGRFPILIERARDAAPFLALGQCLETLDMSWMAVSVYRRLTRTFGSKRAREVALPLARASLASGDAPMARAAAQAAIKSDPERREAWTLVLAEAELRSDHAGRSVKLLRPLLRRSGRSIDRGFVSSALLFARALSAQRATSKQDRLLVHGLLESVPEKLREQRALDFGEACLWAAELERISGEVTNARELHAWAAEALPEGRMKAQSQFWQFRLATKKGLDGAFEATRGSDVSVAAPSKGGAWSDLARFEIAFRPLRVRFGE